MNRLVISILILTMSLFAFTFADNSQEINDKLRASGVVGENQTILITSNVYFYPNKKGYSIISGGKDREKGHIVFTDTGLAVVSWSRRNETYEVLYQVNYKDLESSDILGNSPMVRLVTKEQNAKKYNSFEIMDSRNAFAPNAEKTKEANDIVNAGIEGLDVTEVASAESLSAVQVKQQEERMQELEERIKRLEQGENGNSEVSSECDCKCPQE